jgi:hypothetical protein
MTGEGNDTEGAFVIAGTYDLMSKECAWTKSYVTAPEAKTRKVPTTKFTDDLLHDCCDHHQRAPSAAA